MTEFVKTGLIWKSNFMTLKTHNSLCGQAIDTYTLLTQEICSIGVDRTINDTIFELLAHL